jgi:hypothetical protein
MGAKRMKKLQEGDRLLCADGRIAIVASRSSKTAYEDALKKIASCQSFADGDVVDIARRALGKLWR